MRYVSNLVSLNPGVGAPASFVFNANDIFDPNETSSGHQPYGHDTLALVYDHYHVLSSRITVQFSSTGGDSLSTGVASIQLNSDSTLPTNSTLLLEQPATTYKHYTPQNRGGICTLSKKFSSSKFYGRSQRKDTSAKFGVSPIEKAFFIISAQGISSLENPAIVDCTVTITYRVRCTEPKNLGQS